MRPVFHHICIQTNDYNQSLVFYQKLGFVLKNESQDFHGRSYNSWLQLGEFYIELQTGKAHLCDSVNIEKSVGIVLFCLWVEDVQKFIDEIKIEEDKFKRKNGNVIYQVAGGNLCKISAPGGTIVEIRDKKSY
ncbi:hypothetical protein AJQ09_05935 [Listeria seeligeri]|uniref:VOC family protein n=1 Tax=Listeria seeligeri TaxID=1640 RepID=UPI0009510624|nr:VOC family protein [Listeria seeligeri]OLQ23993.1 hypothetical protein AJQ09_05935 [Listeria seeligeri]